jgi:pyruvate/2-oxoglutarate dehydrogenase complex dihydrolipoamide dehydrogenase (E3) component
VDSALIQKIRPEVLVIATGSKPALPVFEGNPPSKVLISQEVLEKKLPQEESFLVMGGGSLGCELAEYLAEKGKKVSVVEILGQIAADAESNARKLLLQRLAEKKVSLHTRSRVQRCEGNKACGVNDSGERVEVPADVVVAAVGAQPSPLALKGLEKMKPAPEIYTIGDCRQAGKIMQAVHDGNRVGRMI